SSGPGSEETDPPKAQIETVSASEPGEHPGAPPRLRYLSPEATNLWTGTGKRNRPAWPPTRPDRRSGQKRPSRKDVHRGEPPSAGAGLRPLRHRAVYRAAGP